MAAVKWPRFPIGMLSSILTVDERVGPHVAARNRTLSSRRQLSCWIALRLTQPPGADSAKLDFLGRFRDTRRGPPLPTEGQLSGRVET
jgi:hypothetical protein